MTTVTTYLQFTISLIGLGITSGLLIYNQDNANIYLPCITAIVFAWLPSPLQSNTKNTNNAIENHS
jgi:hypothetical protein